MRSSLSIHDFSCDWRQRRVSPERRYCSKNGTLDLSGRASDGQSNAAEFPDAGGDTDGLRIRMAVVLPALANREGASG